MTKQKFFTPFLLPLRGQPKLSPIIGFDTETYGELNKFQIGAVSTPQADYVFENAKDMLDFICKREYWNHKVFATNLGFDAFALFQAEAGDSKMPDNWSFFDNGSKLIYVRKMVSQETRSETGTKKHKYQTLLDSLNIFPAGVEQMGQILLKVSEGYERQGNLTLANYYKEPKLKAPAWLGKRKWQDLTNQEKIVLAEYCMADARVTRKFMEWFSEQISNLGGEMRMTAASTALDLFRRKYLNEANIVIPQPRWDCMVESRLSYYGGRTEDFVKGTIENVWDNDVTSMYPGAMIEIQYPYPSPEKFLKREYPPESCLQNEGFSKCTIKVPYMHIPPLPFRQGPKLIFPYGTLTGVWTNLEIRYAISIGCKVEEIEWSYFNSRTFNPFTEYVLDLFEKRMSYAKQKMATEEVVKLFLNGLYGKFAQNFLTEQQAEELGVLIKKSGGTFKRIEDGTPEEIEYTASNHPDYLAKGFVINKAIPKLKAFMNPILSSYTTARARVKLHEMMIQAKKEGSKIVYVDTDSIYCTKRLSFAVKDKQLGKLQEGKSYKEMLIVGPKSKRLIREDGKVISTAKGVPGKSFLTTFKTKRSIKIAPRDNLFAGMKGGKLKTRYSKFLKFKEAMARGLLPNQIVEMTKEFDPFEFPKRRIIGQPTIIDLLNNQYETEPWEIDAKTQLVIGEENA